MDLIVNPVLSSEHFNTIAVSSGRIDITNSTAAYEAVFMAENTEPITHVGIHCRLLAGTTPTYKVSLQGVTITGSSPAYPDGTIKGGGSPASATVNPTSAGWTAGSFYWIALDNSYTPTKGEILSIVFKYDSGTVDGSNYVSISEVFGNAEACNLSRTHQLSTAGSRTYRDTTGSGGWRTATRRYGGGGLMPFKKAGTIATSNETAMKFTVPSDIATCDLWKIKFNWANSLPTGDVTVTGYSGGDVTDTSLSWTQTLNRYLLSVNRPAELQLDTDWSLTGGSTYRLSISGSSNLTYVEVAEVEDWQMTPSRGWSDAGICVSTRSGGNWTDTTTKRIEMRLMMRNVTMTGGGGSVLHPLYATGRR